MRAVSSIASVLLLAAFARPTTPALDDPTIVAIFDAANTLDVETGELALPNSPTPRRCAPSPPSLSATTPRIHPTGAGSRQEAGRHTHTTGQARPDRRTQEGDGRPARAKSGAEFDKAYADTEVAYHQAVSTRSARTLLPAIQERGAQGSWSRRSGRRSRGTSMAAKQLQKTLGQRGTRTTSH